jgi:hypothetical protein
MTVDGMFCMIVGRAHTRAQWSIRLEQTHTSTEAVYADARKEGSIGPQLSGRAARSVNSYVDDSRCRRTPHSTSPRPRRVVCVPADAIRLISRVHGQPHKRVLPANGWLHGLWTPRIGATNVFMQTAQQASDSSR